MKNLSNDLIIANLYKDQNEFYIKGQDEERAKIAQELHDGTSGSLYGIKLHLQFLKNNSTDASGIISKIEKQIDALSLEIKNITKKISPLTLKNFGLNSSINEYIIDYQLDTTSIEFNCGLGEERFANDLEANVFRIIQECITNILKHAQATTILIDLHKSDNYLQLKIEDNGKGILIAPEHNGNGLSNILYRLQLLNGTIDIISKTHYGTKTQIKIQI